jgi:pimeloyl-ACP methyl ester carboxylesterase
MVASRVVRANGVDFTVLEAGVGPLALCLHGFPDSAHTWRHLLPRLAQAGFHAVAPFMRGYAPTSVPQDGCYHLGALVADTVALHEALDGDQSAVLIGHDFGAEAAYGAAAFSPDRWRSLITLAVPPLALDSILFGDYDQLKRFFYIFLFQMPLAEAAVSADEMGFLGRLWKDWSPGYDPADDLEYARDCLRDAANLSAALGYYRAAFPAGEAGMYTDEYAAASRVAPHPTLYLHGSADGCIGVELIGEAERHLAPGSQIAIIDGAGHFPHLERPDEVNERILRWLA